MSNESIVSMFKKLLCQNEMLLELKVRKMLNDTMIAKINLDDVY